MSEEKDRHSKVLEAELISDSIARAEAEARNGIRQFDAVVELIDYFLSPDCNVKTSPIPSAALAPHRARRHQFVCGQLPPCGNRNSRQPTPAGWRASGA